MKIPFHLEFSLRERDGSFKDARPMVTNWVDTNNNALKENDDDHARILHTQTYNEAENGKLIKVRNPKAKLALEVGNEEYYVYGVCKPDIFVDEAFSREISLNMG